MLTAQGNCLQAWARLEAKRGNLDKARQLFRLGADCDPSHTYIWQAWGVMEFNAGDLDRARELFQEVSFGVSLDLRGSCWARGSRLGVPQRRVHEGYGGAPGVVDFSAGHVVRARKIGELGGSGSGFRETLLARWRRLGRTAIRW